MQGSVSFLEKKSERAKGGPEARKGVLLGYLAGKWFQLKGVKPTLPSCSPGLWRWGPPHRRWDAPRTRSGQSSPPHAAPCWATGKLRNAADLLGIEDRNGPKPQGAWEGGSGPLSWSQWWGVWDWGWGEEKVSRRGRKRDKRRRGRQGGRGRGREGCGQGRKSRNTLSRALIFAPLFSNNFKTSKFPPRLAQWMAVDSSYTRKVQGHDLI